MIMVAATPTQIKAWKKQYGRIYRFQVKTDSGEKAIGIFKAPSLDTILAMGEFLKDDKAKTLTILYNQTKVKVDDIVEQDEQVKFAMIQQIKNLWKNYKVEVEEL